MNKTRYKGRRRAEAPGRRATALSDGDIFPRLPFRRLTARPIHACQSVVFFIRIANERCYIHASLKL